MPVIFDEVTASVEPDPSRAASEAEPPSQTQTSEQEHEKIREWLARREILDARLFAN